MLIARQISAQKAYISEKVDKTYFASDERVRAMMDRMETLYAARFSELSSAPGSCSQSFWKARGDKKKAMERSVDSFLLIFCLETRQASSWTDAQEPPCQHVLVWAADWARSPSIGFWIVSQYETRSIMPPVLTH